MCTHAAPLCLGSLRSVAMRSFRESALCSFETARAVSSCRGPHPDKYTQGGPYAVVTPSGARVICATYESAAHVEAVWIVQWPRARTALVRLRAGTSMRASALSHCPTLSPCHLIVAQSMSFADGAPPASTSSTAADLHLNNTSNMSSPADADAVIQLFKDNDIACETLHSADGALMNSVLLIGQNLQQLSSCAQSEINQKVLMCVLFARTARALEQALNTFAPFKRHTGADALYTWMSKTLMVSQTWIVGMRRFQSEGRKLWSTDDDCLWWETHIQCLNIKSFNRLKHLSSHADTMTLKLGGDTQRREYWLKELKQPRRELETRQTLESEFSHLGEDTMQHADCLQRARCFNDNV